MVATAEVPVIAEAERACKFYSGDNYNIVVNDNYQNFSTYNTTLKNERLDEIHTTFSYDEVV